MRFIPSSVWKKFFVSASLVFCLQFADSKPIKVVVPIEPYRFLVEQIGGDAVETIALVPETADPHHYSPTGKQMRFIADADVYFYAGLPFEEQNLKKFLHNSTARKVSLINGFQLLKSEHEHGDDAEMDSHDHEMHAHEDSDHLEQDPHVWTDPNRYKIQAQVICHFLSELNPSQLTVFKNNTTHLVRRLEDLDQQFRESLADDAGKRLLVFHPAWSYFCEAYGLEQVSVEKEGKPLGAKALATLLHSVDTRFFPILLIQPQMNAKMPEQLAREVGLEVAVVNPLAYDYFGAMETLLSVLKTSVSLE